MTKCYPLLGLLLAAHGAAQSNFLLDIAEGTTVPVPPDSKIPIHVIYAGDDANVKQFKLLASRFGNDQDSVPVQVLKDCGAKNSLPQPAAFDLDENRTASLCLLLPPLRTDGKYAGRLTVFPDNKKAETPKGFNVSRVVVLFPAATLATDRQAATIQVIRPFWARFTEFSPTLATVTLQEKSGKGTAQQVATQTDATFKSSSSFDPATGLKFTWNGGPWEHPFQTPVAGTSGQNLNATEQAQIAISGIDLSPGEYTIPLHFSAPGATADGAHFAMTVQVRDSVVWAIAVLLLALCLSLVITKVITGRRRRIALLQQVAQLKVSKGTTLPPLPAVVWVESVLHLAKALSSRFWLTGADTIDSHINSVKSTVDILRQARELREGLQCSLPHLVFRRAEAEINRVVSELGMEPPDDTWAAHIKGELAALNNWLQPSTYPAALWSAIQPALQRLKAEIETAGIAAPQAATLQPLKNKLDAVLTGTPPQSSSAAETAYQDYARLRILWDRRDNNEAFTKLTSSPPPELTECFRINDGLDWTDVQAKVAELYVEMEASSDPDGSEAFAPIAFHVRSRDSRIADSYLLRNNVKFAWKFILHPKKRRLRGTPQDVILSPTTQGPSIMQYFPERGDVRVSVTLSYGDGSVDIPAKPICTIMDSGDYGILRAFEGVEYLSWGIAAVVALATGLMTYYYKNATFGSPQDYLTLALWGAGMDQGKNILQALQSVSNQAASAGPH